MIETVTLRVPFNRLPLRKDEARELLKLEAGSIVHKMNHPNWDPITDEVTFTLVVERPEK